MNRLVFGFHDEEGIEPVCHLPDQFCPLGLDASVKNGTWGNCYGVCPRPTAARQPSAANWASPLELSIGALPGVVAPAVLVAYRVRSTPGDFLPAWPDRC